MSKLSAKQRKDIPKSEFGVPEKAPASGSFPIPDKSHATAALGLIGHASPEDRSRIKAKAEKMLGHKDGEAKKKEQRKKLGLRTERR